MHPIRNDLLTALFNEVLLQSYSYFGQDARSNEELFQELFGLSEEDLSEQLKRIVISIPDYIFYSGHKTNLLDVMRYIAYEFILFQCQEDSVDPNYSLLFLNFIDSIHMHLTRCYFTKGKNHATR